jgi:hypothetical protein
MARHGRPGPHDRLGRHGHHSRQVATLTHVTKVAQVATVAPRSSTAGTLLLSNNLVRTAQKTQHFTITNFSLLTLIKEINLCLL